MILSNRPLAAIVAGAALLLGATATRAAPPNFVFIIADDLTFRDVGCYGGQARTPRIDRLAAEGLLMERCFQTAPMCSPTRHSIYTGLYPVKSGAYPNHTRAYPQTRSVAHYLKPQGYRVALSGKRHINPPKVFPFEYSGNNNPDMAAIDRLFTEAAATGAPFALFACSNEPHSPWNKGDASQYPPAEVQLPPYLADTPQVRADFSRYLAEVTYFDRQVGQILDLLDQHKLADNTLVMVVSEQGNSFPFAKWTCYDSGLQSAMVVRWPGKTPVGRTSSAMVEYVDICPTFVEASGAVPAAAMDGQSFLKVLTGETDAHKRQTYGLMTTRGIINGSDCYPIRSIRTDRFKLIWNLSYETRFTNACTQAAYFQSMVAAGEAGDETARLLTHRYQFRPQFELYDIQQDPLELRNLADSGDHAGTRQKLLEQLQAWMKSQGDEGIATELKANERQGGRRQKNKGRR